MQNVTAIGQTLRMQLSLAETLRSTTSLSATASAAIGRVPTFRNSSVRQKPVIERSIIFIHCDVFKAVVLAMNEEFTSQGRPPF